MPPRVTKPWEIAQSIFDAVRMCCWCLSGSLGLVFFRFGVHVAGRLVERCRSSWAVSAEIPQVHRTKGNMRLDLLPPPLETHDEEENSVRSEKILAMYGSRYDGMVSVMKFI